MQIGLNLALTLEHGGAGAPTLDMTFTGTGNALDSRITFTRASTATYFDSAGVLTSAAINAPRFDYNPSTLAARGLLIEEQRTNVLLYSEDFGNAAWVKQNGATITTDAAVSPAGTQTADRLQISPFQYVYSQVSLVSGVTYTISVFVKTVSGGTQFKFNIFGSGNNFVSGNQTATASWQRYSYTFTATGTGATSIYLPIVDGLSAAVFDVWGAQLEAGAFPTSYIPTTTTALTRSADVASVNTLSPWYNATAGTIYAEAVTFDSLSGASPAATTFSDGTTNNRTGIVRNNGTGNARMSIVSGGVAQAAADATAWTLNATAKIALAFATNDFAIVANGGVVTTDTSGSVPTANQLRLASDWGGNGQFLNGYLRRITYYPRRLSNAELQAITA